MPKAALERWHFVPEVQAARDQLRWARKALEPVAQRIAGRRHFVNYRIDYRCCGDDSTCVRVGLGASRRDL